MSTERKLRADARLNRDQLLAAARELIAERGADVPADEIARRAGVGTGTLYRRFPNREALVGAVATDGLVRVVELARAAEDEQPTAWQALTRFIQQSAEELRLATWLSIWFASAWTELRADPETQRLRRTLLNILDRLVRAAQADGDLRPDVDAADLALMLAMLLRPIPRLEPGLGQDSVDRYLTLMLDSLRAHPGTSPLPDHELTIAHLVGD